MSGGSYKDLAYFKRPAEFMPIRETRVKRRPEEARNDYQSKASGRRAAKSTKS